MNENRKEYLKNYYANPINRKRRCETSKKYYYNNKDKIREYRETEHFKQLNKEQQKRYYEKNKEKIKKHKQSEHCKLLEKGYKKKYRENNRDKINEYHQTEHFKQLRKEQNKRYREKHKEELRIKSKDWNKKYNIKTNYSQQKRYRKTIKGKENSRKLTATRNRKLGYIQIIDNPFPEEIEVDYHHINDLLVVPIPRGIHIKNNHPNVKIHRVRCSKFIEWFYGLKFERVVV